MSQRPTRTRSRTTWTLGAREGRDPHPLFQTQFYLEQNPDVAASGLNPLVHFVRFGGAEGRNPHPAFDSSFYLARYPDVAAAHVNPLIHYLTLGAAEHRDPSEGFVTAFYVQENPEAAAAGSNPLVHYVEIGQRSGRRCTPVSVERTTANDLVFEDSTDLVRGVRAPPHSGADTAVGAD